MYTYIYLQEGWIPAVPYGALGKVSFSNVELDRQMDRYCVQEEQ